MTARSDTRCHACGRSLPQWTKAQIVERLTAWSGTHGRAPRSSDWHTASYHTPSASTVRDRFGSWNNALDAAGLMPAERKGWTRDGIIRALWDWREKHGTLPVTRDWLGTGDGHPSHTTVCRLFGTWNRAIIAAGYEPRHVRRRSRVAA